MNRSGARRADKWMKVMPAFLVLGCNSILGIDSGHPRATDAATDAPVEVDARDADIGDAPVDTSTGDELATCPSAREPPRPSKDDDPSRVIDLPEMAIETLEIEDDGHVGLDIDHHCSTSADPTGACELPSQPTPYVWDGEPDGRDITGNKLMVDLVDQGETAFSQTSLQKRLDAGAFGGLIRLRKYNGLANDQLVTVEFFGKAWMQPDDAGAQPIPRRDGSDTWTVYPDSTVLDIAVEQDLAAYVTNYTLVAHLKVASVALRPDTGNNDNPFVMEFHDAILIGKLVPTDHGFRMEGGNLAGRIPSNRLLASFGSLANGDGFICRTHPFYLLLQIQLCAARDVMADSAQDDTKKTCDAVSFGMGFTAGPAHIGAVPASPALEPSTCGDDWQPTCE
jgi:hypothetical protein